MTVRRAHPCQRFRLTRPPAQRTRTARRGCPRRRSAQARSDPAWCSTRAARGTCSSSSVSVSARNVRPRAGTSASATGAPADPQRPVARHVRGVRGVGAAEALAHVVGLGRVERVDRAGRDGEQPRVHLGPGPGHDRRRDRAVPRHVRGEHDVGVGQDDRRREHRRRGALAELAAQHDRRRVGPVRDHAHRADRDRRRPRRPAATGPAPRRARGTRVRGRPRRSPSLGQAASARERASSTSAAITTLASSASGCHCTPRAKRAPGSSIASGRSSLRRPARHLQAVADPVDGLVVMGLRRDPDAAGRARGERTGRQTDVVVAERARDPPVVLVADELGHVLVQRPPARDVEDLHPAAHAEHRHVARERAAKRARARTRRAAASWLTVCGWGCAP